MEFHISRKARDRYQFDESLFSIAGNVILGDFQASRIFAQKINAHRDLERYPEQTIRAGQLNAMGLIDEILHFVFGKYQEQNSPKVLEEALSWLYQKLGKEVVDATLEKFTTEFPPIAVYQGHCTLNQYLSGETQLPNRNLSNKAITLEEMILLWLANENPAFLPYRELFDDGYLTRDSVYLQIIASLRQFFEEKPYYGPDNTNIIDMLRSPAIVVPYSLFGQLDYIRSRWGYLLGELILRLLISLDFIKEEEKIAFADSGKSIVYEFHGLELEEERFSRDSDWMPNLVLIAKNTHVWLDQLSRQYQSSITRLDQIPDQELDRLAKWGFSGLWLIGLWERSQASKQIKRMRGNPEAEASAYSLYEYTIAKDLGGEDARQNLQKRAWQRGIRLASDMVPNHMGIDSTWIMEHPDWFISLDHSPFPSYTFNGHNLSWNAQIGIYLEDHYYNNSDAAVVFKRVDFSKGQEKYIYHGNDGTSMPWNDTAQLNYLKPNVREAVIQTIIQVSRRFPIIRFDAAMILSKRHFQRLWYPEAGSGGDIPTRSEYGLSKEKFNELFPKEFWREVVDRVTEEAPNTLLLAEAFWLMEGYFVRTLGMHRVYNSAFMNMLRDERNQEYRQVIKNTLEFDPEILKRYVNFMNNPDERTAIDQFDKGDKYFGICTMMVTMPGLPMFGHGQIEGFTEKYGMEYRRAYWNETPDSNLVERHERQIFPLIRKRYIFSGVSDFFLYDFFTKDGSVNEDVFAYSNRVGEERSLVIYNNRFSRTRGWIRVSAAYLSKSEKDEGRFLNQKSLAEGLGLESKENIFTIFRDHISGVEYIRNNRDLTKKGLYIELNAYQCHVFLDFRQVQDSKHGTYKKLTNSLAGRGVPSIDIALKEITLGPIQNALRELANPGQFQWIVDHRIKLFDDQAKKQSTLNTLFQEIEGKLVFLLNEARKLGGGSAIENELAREICLDIKSLMDFPRIQTTRNEDRKPWIEYLRKGIKYENEIDPINQGKPFFWGIALSWLIIQKLGKIRTEKEQNQSWQLQSLQWLNDWQLDKILAHNLSTLSLDEYHVRRGIELINILTVHSQWFYEHSKEQNYLSITEILKSWLTDGNIQDFMGVNLYNGEKWFNKEDFEEFIWWMYIVAMLHQWKINNDLPLGEILFAVVQKILTFGNRSEYKMPKLLELIANEF